MSVDDKIKLINIDEAAEMLNVSKKTLQRWDKANKLKAIRLTPNGERKYKQEDLDRMINAERG